MSLFILQHEVTMFFWLPLQTIEHHKRNTVCEAHIWLQILINKEYSRLKGLLMRIYFIYKESLDSKTYSNIETVRLKELDRT